MVDSRAFLVQLELEIEESMENNQSFVLSSSKNNLKRLVSTIQPKKVFLSAKVPSARCLMRLMMLLRVVASLM